VDEHLTFRVLALRTNGIITIDHTAISQDDRGAIAVSSNSVLYTGDGGTARWNIDTLAGGVNIGRSAESPRDRSADGNALLPRQRQCRDRLRRDDYVVDRTHANRRADGPPHRPVAAHSYVRRFPSGWESLRAWDVWSSYNRTNTFSIAIPSGVVTDLGPTPLPVRAVLGKLGILGVAEYFGDAVHLLYVDGSTSPRRNIIRLSLPSGNITTAATFTNLNDMAVFTFSPSRSRWFFHYEVDSLNEVLGSAKALFTTDPGFPSILRHPQSQTNYPGGTVTFSVAARGASLLYQWFFNGNPIAGATEAILVLDNVTQQHAGNYTVRVSNDRGSACQRHCDIDGVHIAHPAWGADQSGRLPGPINGLFLCS
jgi:hypothetical protein